MAAYVIQAPNPFPPPNTVLYQKKKRPLWVILGIGALIVVVVISASAGIRTRSAKEETTKSTLIVLTISGSMHYARNSHTASNLTDGQILVTGGCGNRKPCAVPDNLSELQKWVFLQECLRKTSCHALNTAEVYNPSTGIWTTTGSMTVPRAYHTASVLFNGQVLVTGGEDGEEGYSNTNIAELYDPITGKWEQTGRMKYFRQHHTASVLSSGNVLVVGGIESKLDSYFPEVYNVSTGTWIVSRGANFKGKYHTATLLENGNVLVAGGYNGSSYLNYAVLYDPSTETWIPIHTMNNARAGHTATLLNDGRVLVTGGYNDKAHLKSTELYDSSTNIWTTTENMNIARSNHTASLLTNGNVLVTDGTVIDVYNPLTREWTIVGTLKHTRTKHTTSVLSNERVLVAGGIQFDSILNITELINYHALI